MKVPKALLQQIVQEETIKHLRSLLEAPKDVSVSDADDEKKGKEKDGGKGDEAPTKPSAGPHKPKQASDKPKQAKPADEPKELPVAPEDGETAGSDDNKDAQLQADKDDAGGTEDAEDVTGGKIADSITGKTVQSITMQPESKILPGAQEIDLTFREIPDPLKILITKSGQVKFHFRGLHNTLGEAAPAVDAPMSTQTNVGDVVKKTNHPEKFSMSNDEYLSWMKNPPRSLKVISAQGGKPIADMDQAQIKWALGKAAFMKGMSKGVSSDAEYWIAPVVRRK